MNSHEALALVRKGHLHTLIDGMKRQESWRNAQDDVRALLAYVLAATGDTAMAAAVLDFDVNQLKLSFRAYAEIALGFVFWSIGDHESSTHHFQAAIRIATDAKTLDCAAWGHLHLFRLASEAQPLDATSAMLRQVRRAVTAAGTPSTPATG